jgi:hypothetical protein
MRFSLGGHVNTMYISMCYSLIREVVDYFSEYRSAGAGVSCYLGIPELKTNPVSMSLIASKGRSLTLEETERCPLL